uniref:SRCR domain-containing protein n=1 Tax=Neogobius melanostomus TaxID=47308 RepID=A0A8C6WFS8_9GOBI
MVCAATLSGELGPSELAVALPGLPGTPPFYDIRLVGPGSSRCSGRVEVRNNRRWGTVCDDNWDMSDATVVCRQLNCGTALMSITEAKFGQGSDPIWFDNVQCSGNESSLLQCQHNGLGSHDCTHTEDAGVVCSGRIVLSGYILFNSYLPEGQIRLVGGSSPCSGRIEIYHADEWRTVCDDHWDWSDAAVVCRQIRCGKVMKATREAQFGEGTAPIWLSDVDCSGSESSLTDCHHSRFGDHKCGHNEDAGVVCSEGQMIRLVGPGSSRCSGRVEVYHNGSWGTVCDDNWDMDDAVVLCRQLDCETAVKALNTAQFGEGTGPIWLDDVSCSGRESSLLQCQHSGFGPDYCKHDEDASAVCS